MDEPLPLYAVWVRTAVLDLESYLSLVRPDVPRREWQRLFAAGRIRSRGRPIGKAEAPGALPDLTVAGGFGDVDRLPLPERTALSILYEDDLVTVVAKPAGLSTIPGRGSDDSCLAELVARELESRSESTPDRWTRPRIVHRLDRSTSGLLIVARTPEAERRLGQDFEGARVRKEYIAVVAGVVEAARIVVDCPLDERADGRVRAGIAGKHASTTFDVRERFRSNTLVVARPRTGRRHQIRVHAWCAGHPILGDDRYHLGQPSAEPLALHAHRYTLPADWPGECREFTCPVPAAMLGRIANLRSW